MPETGWKYPGTITSTWNNKDYAKADDGNVAYQQLNYSSDSTELRATAFGISSLIIPADARIVGVQVCVDRGADIINVIVDKTVRLYYGGAVGDNKAKTTTYWTGMAQINYGGGADLWGYALTQAIVTNAGFGVTFYAHNNGIAVRPNAMVDFIAVNVWWRNTPIVINII